MSCLFLFDVTHCFGSLLCILEYVGIFVSVRLMSLSLISFSRKIAEEPENYIPFLLIVFFFMEAEWIMVSCDEYPSSNGVLMRIRSC